MPLHQRYLVVAHRMALLRRRGPLPVGPEFPAARGRIQCGLEQFIQLRGELGVLDLSQHLHAAIEVAVHHIGAADPEFVDVAEMDDPRVLEEAPENGAHNDVFR